MVATNVVQFPAQRRDREPVYPWLKSSYPAMKWVVTAGPASRIGSNEEPRSRTIDFGFQLPDGSKLSDPRNASWLALAKRYAVLLREHEHASLGSAALHALQVQCLFLVLAWMQMEGIHYFEDLRHEDIARYTLAAKFGTPSVLKVAERAAALRQPGAEALRAADVRKALGLSKMLNITEEVAIANGSSNGSPRIAVVHNTLFRMLLVFEDLWRLRRDIEGDNIRIEPFETSASATAAKHCSDTNRTPTIPHRQAMTLVDGCIRILIEVGHRPARHPRTPATRRVVPADCDDEPRRGDRR